MNVVKLGLVLGTLLLSARVGQAQENQDEMKTYVQDIMKLIGAPPGDPEPSRKFHISIANLTGKTGDSVR